MKKKVEKMTREDWEKVAACAKLMYLKSMDLLCLNSSRFGKTNHVAKKANRIYKLMNELKSEMHSLACSNAQGLFSDGEIDKLFYGD